MCHLYSKEARSSFVHFQAGAAGWGSVTAGGERDSKEGDVEEMCEQIWWMGAAQLGSGQICLVG